MVKKHSHRRQRGGEGFALFMSDTIGGLAEVKPYSTCPQTPGSAAGYAAALYSATGGHRGKKRSRGTKRRGHSRRRRTTHRR